MGSVNNLNVKESFILDYLKEKKRFVLSSELTEKLIEKYPSISNICTKNY